MDAKPISTSIGIDRTVALRVPLAHSDGLFLVEVAYLALAFPVLLLLTAFSPLLLLKAAFQTWGRYVVAVSGHVLSVFNGVGTLGRTKRFELTSKSDVRLRTVYGRRGSIRKNIVVNSERALVFGEALSDEQRYYVAQVLLARKPKT